MGQTKRDDNCLAFFSRLFEAVINDVSKLCGVAPREAERDVKYLKLRLSNEGLSFVTSVLPQLGNAIGTAFQSGRFSSMSALKCRCRTALPSFLHGLTKQVFKLDGSLRDDASSEAVWGLRQICFLVYKYDFPYPRSIEEEKILSMMQVDASLPKTITTSDLTLRGKTVLALARDIVTEMMSEVDLTNLVPRHGPGSTATGRMTATEKTVACLMRDRSLSGFPDLYGRNHCLDVTLCARHTSDDTPLVQSLEVAQNRATIQFVRKDIRGPRGISCEQAFRMHAQQALRWPVEKAAHQFSSGRINFKDQTVNQRLALRGSSAGRWATLDMKDASDRVSLALVTELFARTEILSLLLASRSKYNIRRKDGEDPVEFYLNKFAPMGSAMCFPVESIVFWALSVASIMYYESDGTDISKIRDRCYVFGDDIIVPTKYADVVMDTIEEFNLLFNREKSFISGPFRESCGCDAFRGVDVTPKRVKTLLPRSIDDATSVVAWVEYSNDFASQWMWKTSEVILDYLNDVGLDTESMPLHYKELGCLSRWTFSRAYPSGVQEKPRHRTKTKVNRNTFEKRKTKVPLPFYQGREILAPAYRSSHSAVKNFNEGAALYNWYSERSFWQRNRVEKPWLDVMPQGLFFLPENGQILRKELLASENIKTRRILYSKSQEEPWHYNNVRALREMRDRPKSRIETSPRKYWETTLTTFRNRRGYSREKFSLKSIRRSEESGSLARDHGMG